LRPFNPIRPKPIPMRSCLLMLIVLIPLLSHAQNQERTLLKADDEKTTIYVGERPGWLRCEQFGAGMITGWGAYHLDTAHRAMGTEYTGPRDSLTEPIMCYNKLQNASYEN
jgi:hypothetical protein